MTLTVSSKVYAALSNPVAMESIFSSSSFSFQKWCGNI